MLKNLNSPAVYQIMKGWDSHILSDLYIRKIVNNCLIEAVIPASLRKKVTGDIPKRIAALLSFPSAENKMKLMLNGVSVKYTFAAEAAADYEEKEVA